MPKLKVQINNVSGHLVYVKVSSAGIPSQQVASGDSYSFDVDNVSAGRIYLSFDQALLSTAPDGPDGANEHDPDYKTRFDKVELTYDGNTGDGNTGKGKANLTAVDFYAIPLMLQTFIHGSDGKDVPVEQLSLKANTTGTQLTQALSGAAIDPAKAMVKNDNNVLVRMLSPAKSPAAYKSMSDYSYYMVTKTITIKGTFFGKPAKDYNYTGTFSSVSLPLKMAGERMVNIHRDTLADVIYTCNGPYYVEGDSKPHHVSDNDLYAAVYRDVISAFNFGYLGGNYGNCSDNWWGNPPFADASNDPNKYYYNKYAAAVYANYPGAYGFPFSDREQHVLASLGGGVDTLRITVLADDKAPDYLPVPGTLNPQSGIVKFNLVPVFSNDINDITGLPFKFGGNNCKAGWINDYKKGPQQKDPHKATQVNDCPAGSGWNKYELTIGRAKYSVIVKVTDNGEIELATISGGGNSNWESPNLFVGGFQTDG